MLAVESRRVPGLRRDAIPGDPAVARQGGRVHLRRWPAAALQRAGPRDPAAQCVKATYFLVGAMAHAYPRRCAGCTPPGTRSARTARITPSRFQSLPLEKLQHEIDDGIAAVSAALGDPKEVAPFFRVPGLAQSEAIEKALAARSLIVFSSDTVADDWFHRIKASEIVRRAMSRLEARGKGILLLHDIHPAIVAALPELLKQLKERGFRIVHVVPAPAAAPVEMAGAPLTLTAAWAERQDDPVWPEVVVTDPVTELAVLPAPDTSSFDVGFKPAPRARIMLADGSPGAAIPGAAATQWPDGSAVVLPSLEVKLPALRKRDLAVRSSKSRPRANRRDRGMSRRRPITSVNALAPSRNPTVISTSLRSPLRSK